MRSAQVKVPVVTSGRRKSDKSRFESRSCIRLISLIVVTIALDANVALLVTNLALRTTSLMEEAA